MRPVHVLILLVGLIFLAVPAAKVHADDNGCPPYSPTVIDMQPQYDDTEYEFKLPMLKIRDIADEGNVEHKNTMHQETWPVGLSTGEMFFEMNYEIMRSHSTTSNRLVCGQIKAIHIHFGFKDNKIYVAKEFPKRSCPYKEALAHEEKHKAVDVRIMNEFTDKIQNVFTELGKRTGMKTGRDPNELDGEITSILDQAMKTVSKELETKHADRQKAVDSPEEYQRFSESCDGQTMQIVRDRVELLEASRPGSTKDKNER